MDHRQLRGYPSQPPDLAITEMRVSLSRLLRGEGARACLSFFLSQLVQSVGPLGPKPGPPFITQGDTIVAEMHTRQMSSIFGWWRSLVALRAPLSSMPTGTPC
jgi:hypothetical protein